MPEKGVNAVTTTQTAVRESLCRRILDLSDEEIGMVECYVSDLEGHEPNEETIAAILEGDELARAYCSRFTENEDTSATK